MNINYTNSSTIEINSGLTGGDITNDLEVWGCLSY